MTASRHFTAILSADVAREKGRTESKPSWVIAALDLIRQVSFWHKTDVPVPMMNVRY